MKIIVWTMSHWDNGEEFRSRLGGQFGLVAWSALVDRLFSPIQKWIVTGTDSDPALAVKDLPGVLVYNAGIPRTHPHECRYWNYSLCCWELAFAAAMLALPETKWDLLVILDNETLLGDVNLDALLREFLERPEVVLGAAWCGCWIGGPLLVFKPEAAEMWLCDRRRENLVEPKTIPEPMLPEEEATKIWAGRWWNPWPNRESFRQDYPEQAGAETMNEQVMNWEMIRKPHPDVIEKYLAESACRTIPVRHEPAEAVS